MQPRHTITRTRRRITRGRSRILWPLRCIPAPQVTFPNIAWYSDDHLVRTITEGEVTFDALGPYRAINKWWNTPVVELVEMSREDIIKMMHDAWLRANRQ